MPLIPPLLIEGGWNTMHTILQPDPGISAKEKAACLRVAAIFYIALFISNSLRILTSAEL